MFKTVARKAIKKVKGFKITRSVFSYPYILFMAIFIVVPLVILLANAFIYDGGFSFKNFALLAKDGSSLNVLGLSIVVGFVTTVLCLLIGYPVAYFLTKMSSGSIIVLFFIMPMWVNFLIRTLATRAMFEMLGIKLGIGTVIFGMVYNYLPFMILPLHTTISNIDKCYSEAAADLGASPVMAFIKSTLPLSAPGIISGITMVFIPTISTFAISQLLGGSYLFGDSIYTKFSTDGMYGVGSVMSLIMLALVLIANFFLSKINKGEAAKNLW